jgi:DHA1 family bicyclomycin/chloramphenicol resistance-like MFS transporter
VNPIQVRTGLLAVLTGLMFSVGPVTVDLSLPAMPTLQRDIGTAQVHVELTLTLLLLGLALSQFVVGAIADRYGRRPMILAGLALYCVGAVLAACSPNLIVFACARLLQAFGMGIAVVLIRSAVSDVCDHRRTASVFSTAVTMVSLASVIAPTVGGQLLAHWGWHSVFVAMAVFAAAVLASVAIFLPETLPPERRVETRLLHVFATYGALFRNRKFATFATISAAAAAYQFTYNTGAPAVLIEHYGISAQTSGLLFSLIAVSTACASQLNAVLLKWAEPDSIMNSAVVLGLLAAVALLVSVFSGAGGVTAFVAALFVLIATIGFVMGNSMAGAISSAGVQAGAASALVGVMQFLFGTIGSACVGFFPDALGRSMGIVIGVLSLVSLAMVLRARPALQTI